MLNDYKPTHDPNLDTFKVQYLIGASAILAILFPYKYNFTEVSASIGRNEWAGIDCETDPLGFLHLA